LNEENFSGSSYRAAVINNQNRRRGSPLRYIHCATRLTLQGIGRNCNKKRNYLKYWQHQILCLSLIWRQI